jgi:hypothetical protein
VADSLHVIGEIRHREILRTAQNKLTIVESANWQLAIGILKWIIAIIRHLPQ